MQPEKISSSHKQYPLSDRVYSALSFLTLLPTPSRFSHDISILPHALPLFPVVGLTIGILSTTGGVIALTLCGEPIHAVIALLISIIVSAGFHLDGLADSCDALFSWRSRERKLEIMKDSRVGTMGALALLIVLHAKYASLVTLGPHWWLAALLAPMWGRTMNLFGAQYFSTAKDEGLASEISFPHHTNPFLNATIISMVTSFCFLGFFSLLLLSTLLPVTYWICHKTTKSLGGLSGDIYGMLSEVAEVLVMLTLCAIY